MHNFMAFYGKEITDPVMLWSLAIELLRDNGNNQNNNDDADNDHDPDFLFDCVKFLLCTCWCDYKNDENNY